MLTYGVVKLPNVGGNHQFAFFIQFYLEEANGISGVEQTLQQVNFGRIQKKKNK